MAQPHLQDQTERVRKVRKDYDIQELNRRADEIEQKESDSHKRLKPARSQAEITRVRQGYAVITLAVLQFAGTAALILHSIFHVF